MADKLLIKVPLCGLRTTDVEVLGSLYSHQDKVYRWVKNAGATSLTATAPALTLPTSSIDAINARVKAPSASAPATQSAPSVLNVAGAAMTAIGPSGSDTGDHGWIQVRGLKKVSMTQSATAADQRVGAVAIATVTDDDVWARSEAPAFDSASETKLFTKRVELVRLHPTTGAATAYSAFVDIKCL